ncbi:VTT domain-containing protein [Anditalea andensis]|uniref:TVP38/TMEM64 family membrane protein n=1 Tax=Anditalea andensis TaxID=1048983 RepID=A0A074L181_9BACT|nr:VTT domain-containing protein [Anditalea andensis]KEO74929.1 hypothetical protein EL17_04430 [Anditalea andensis]
MSKKKSNFKRLKIILSRKPTILWAVIWVSIMPTIGSFFFLKFLYSNIDTYQGMDIFTWPIFFTYLIGTALVMGAAVMPTTLIAIVSGFVFGWKSFFVLILSYTLASILGFKLGTALDEHSLDILLERYPKTKALILKKEKKMSELVFFLRLSPVIPFALSNLLFAMIRADLKKVIWVGLWGMLPRTSLAFLTGYLAQTLSEAMDTSTDYFQLTLIIVLFVASIWGLYRVLSPIISNKK